MTAETPTTTRKLTCRLTGDELRAYGSEMARLIREVTRLKVAKKENSDRDQREIDARVDRVGIIAAAVDAGQEERDVICEIRRDYSALAILHVRTDPEECWPEGTTAEVHTRAMTEDERQETLPLAGAEQAAAEPGVNHAVEVLGKELVGDHAEKIERPKPTARPAGFRPEAT